MNFPIPVTNKTMELADCRDAWFFDPQYNAWCLEDILYASKATTPKFQRLSIYVPAPYMKEGGFINESGALGKYTATTAPILFANNSAGYMQMPHTWLGGPRDDSAQFLSRGIIYVTAGSRGRESRDQDGVLCGKSPWTLIDLKTAIRFLRHNKTVLPGDWNKIISMGTSAGGAMSTLLGVTGNNRCYNAFLTQNGAFMDERDDVLASQIYCPIIDLDHADIAYEWQFHNDEENEDSPAGPAGKMTPFHKAFSAELAKEYIQYFNSLGLKDESGIPLLLGSDGRSGTAYTYLMQLLNDSATEYLTRLSEGRLEAKYTPADYLSGNYTYKAPAPKPAGGPGKKDDIGLHHAGAAVMMPPIEEEGPDGMPGAPDDAMKTPGGMPGRGPKPHLSLGDLVCRPPKGVEYKPMEPPMVDTPGKDKRAWLTWDGKRAEICDLDTYILNHRRRMKPCTSFDTLGNDSGENQEFGTADHDYMHFDEYLLPALEKVKDAFPEEYARYHDEFAAVIGDKELARRRYLINPFKFIGTDEKSDAAAHYRIRVGASDADTAFTMTMTLACKLAMAGKDTDYALVWDLPHCSADYPGEAADWVESFT